jgi:hypothetical protein
MRWVGFVACMGEINAYKVFVVRPEGKTPPRRPRHRWDDNIRMDFRKIGWEVVDWIHLIQDWEQWWALVNMVMNL